MHTLSRLIAVTATVVLAAGCVPDDPDQGAATASAETGPSAAQSAAVPYIGLTPEAALDLAVANDDVARIGTMADVGAPGQSEDYVVDRLTFVVRDATVVEVIVETESGPETVAAG